MTKVVHLQKSILSTGRVPLRLHNAMLEAGFDSSVLTMDFDVNLTEKMAEAGRSAKVKARIDQAIHSKIIGSRIKKQFGLYSFPILGSDLSHNKFVKDSDAIYLHWVQGGFMNMSSYIKLAKLKKPVIIFMHDMWTITGGCHHSFGCNKYTYECSVCPMFEKNGIFDFPRIEFRKKKEFYEAFDNLYFVSPSKWLTNCSKQSSLIKDKPVYHIPNIIDTNLFKPVGKDFARKLLNLNVNETIISFGAFSISSAYKGWNELIKALNYLSLDTSLSNLTILVFGSGLNKEIAAKVPFKTHFMGFLKDEYSTVLIYNASDIFVTPSLADNFPTTVLECLACGTPVVGFNIGGIPEIIEHKENGYLAKYKDSEDLASGIKFCIETNLKGRLSQEFSKENLIRKHSELLGSII